jgi:hypothetical protein
MLAKTKNYRPSDKEPFMNERQREYFRAKLLAWREDILKEAKETLQHLQEENQNHPDLADRASSETDRAIERRNGTSGENASIATTEEYSSGVAPAGHACRRWLPSRPLPSPFYEHTVPGVSRALSFWRCPDLSKYVDVG